MTLQGIRNVFQQCPFCWHSFVGFLCFVLVLYIDTRKILCLYKNTVSYQKRHLIQIRSKLSINP